MPYAISDDNLYGDIEFLFRNFERVDGGWKAIKAFGQVYNPPNRWVIEPGSIITEGVDYDRYDNCSYGINIANDVEWMCSFTNSANQIWEMFIPDDADIVIPYGTDGKIRTNKAVIVKAIGYIENSEFHPAE